MVTCSNVIRVQCQPCSMCYKQTDLVFNPATSASYTDVLCGSPAYDALLVNERHCHAGKCGYEAISSSSSSYGHFIKAHSSSDDHSHLRPSSIILVQNHKHTKLELVHRNQISSSTKLLNHSQRFLSCIQMDIKMRAALTHLLSPAKSYEVENLDTDLVSD
ncbi:hypothetical protein LWI28_027208 [Acer negundo]|uniref:Xylanase inhibitor N-terminal domain-containing protein n=1 Tax=Acer negundo TaxID=4023 RepID=A0AAD5IP88_ACENE|nr:hypothetical protein LWI28_027208 [Acer negundo]